MKNYHGWTWGHPVWDSAVLFTQVWERIHDESSFIWSWHFDKVEVLLPIATPFLPEGLLDAFAHYQEQQMEIHSKRIKMYLRKKGNYFCITSNIWMMSLSLRNTTLPRVSKNIPNQRGHNDSLNYSVFSIKFKLVSINLFNALVHSNLLQNE